MVSTRFWMLNAAPAPPNRTLLPTEAETANRIAGPTAREPCCMASFNATALGSRSRGTKFGVND